MIRRNSGIISIGSEWVYSAGPARKLREGIPEQGIEFRVENFSIDRVFTKGLTPNFPHHHEFRLSSFLSNNALKPNKTEVKRIQLEAIIQTLVKVGCKGDLNDLLFELDI